MKSDAFCQAVRNALDASPIVLATIQQHTQSFTDQVKKRKDVALFQISPENKNVLAAAIENMMTRMLHSGGAAF